MPFKSRKQEKWAFATHQPFAKKWATMTDQSKLKKKYKLVVNNKMKGALGAAQYKDKKPTGKIEINVKNHKGDKAELASTIKHEMMHVKHPKMTEKEVYKRTTKTNISPEEQRKLLAKLHMKSTNYKGGAIKRKFKMGKGTNAPGELISKMNEQKQSTIKNNNQPISKERLAILGLV